MSRSSITGVYAPEIGHTLQTQCYSLRNGDEGKNGVPCINRAKTPDLVSIEGLAYKLFELDHKSHTCCPMTGVMGLERIA